MLSAAQVKALAAETDRQTDYRNPVLGEVMKALRYIERFGAGVARVRREMAANGNPAPRWEFAPTYVQVTVPHRPASPAATKRAPQDWPEKL